MTTQTDALGVTINIGDTATIIYWGGSIRKADVREKVTVTGFTHKGNLTHDTDAANGQALHPGCVAVARRDGNPGHEGNAK